MLPLLMVLLLISLPVRAESPRAGPGSLLRLTVPCEPENRVAGAISAPGCLTEGRLIRRGPDILELVSGDSTLVFPLGSIRRMELRETGSRWRLGAGAGFVVGTTAAFLVLHSGGSTSLCNQDQNQDAIGSGECLGLAALVGGLPGAGLGALLGSRLHHERWRKIGVDQIHMSWVPHRDGEIRVVLAGSF